MLLDRSNTCAWDLLWEVVIARAFAVHIGGSAMQTAAKGIGVPERYGDDFHAELVELFLLMYFAGLYAHRLVIEY